MKFNEIELEYLNIVMQTKENITVVGVNEFGDEFESVGKVTRINPTLTNCNDEVLEESGIMLEIADEEFSAPYKTGFTENVRVFSCPEFLIMQIKDQRGNVVFHNREADAICNKCFDHGHTKEKYLKEDGRDIKANQMDPVTNELQKMIGQPVVLTSEKGKVAGVICEVGGITNFGCTMVTLREQTFVKGVFVGPDTKLETLNSKGERVVVAQNNKQEHEAMFRERAKNVVLSK